MTLTTLSIDDLMIQVQDISESYGEFGQDAFLDTFLFKVRSSLNRDVDMIRSGSHIKVNHTD